MLAWGPALAASYCANQGTRPAAMTMHSLEAGVWQAPRSHCPSQLAHSTLCPIRDLDPSCGASGMHDYRSPGPSPGMMHRNLGACCPAA